MADTMKKYIDNLSAQELINQIKGADTKVLQDSKDYADSLADNYDVAGSSASVKSELDAEVSRATAKENELAASIEGVKITADKATEDISAINNTETGILAQAKADAKGKADAVQANVDALSEKVGEVPEGYTDVIDVSNKKTSGIATSDNLAALTTRVGEAEKDIATLETKDIELVAKDAELEGAIATEKSRAEGIEAGLRTDVDAIKGDYLKAADKEALQTQITKNANAITTLTDGVDPDKVDGVKDLVTYVEEHGTEVTGIKTDISNLQKDMTQVQSDIDGVEAAVITKAEQTALTAEITARIEADTALSARVTAVEGLVGEGGSVDEKISTAKGEAISAAAADATTKANAAEVNATKHADDLNTAMDTRVKAVEADKHTHTNKVELDKIAEGDVAKWNTAEQNAKDYSDDLNTAMTAKVDGVEGKADKNATDIANLTTEVGTKASATALSEEIVRARAKETELENSIAQFVALTPEEVKAMWAGSTAE